MLGNMVAALAIVAWAPDAAATTPATTPVTVERFGVYIVVEDIDRSRTFYERVFAKAPQMRTKAMVGFDLASGLFAIVSRAQYAPDVKRGDSAVPYIKVANVEALFDHVRSVAPASLRADKVSVEGPFRFFKMRDLDGNVVEFFSVGTASR